MQALLQCCMLWCTLLGANYLALSIVKRSTPPSRKHAGMQSKCSKDESISAEGPSPYCTTPPPSPVSVTSVGLLGSVSCTTTASIPTHAPTPTHQHTHTHAWWECFGVQTGAVMMKLHASSCPFPSLVATRPSSSLSSCSCAHTLLHVCCTTAPSTPQCLPTVSHPPNLTTSVCLPPGESNQVWHGVTPLPGHQHG